MIIVTASGKCGRSWICPLVLFAISFNSEVAMAVLFRLPLAADSPGHDYFDRNPSPGVAIAWNGSNTETYDGHRGTDYSGLPRNTPVYAAASGELIEREDGYEDGSLSETEHPNGNFVRLSHGVDSTGKPIISVYLHLEKNSVTTKPLGSIIACGEQIGGIGMSGHASGLHLHFETQTGVPPNRVAFDPYASSGETSWWVNQGSGSPSTACQGTGSFGFQMVNATSGTPVGGAYVTWWLYATTTDNMGVFYFNNVPCGITSALMVTAPGYQDYTETYTSLCSTTPQQSRDCQPGQSCPSGPVGSAAIPSLASARFEVGDIVQVFGTTGLGLRAWADTCSGDKIVKPDGTFGTIVADPNSPQCCGGYTRWKILWDGDSTPRWSAEGDPSTGEFWLTEVSSCTQPEWSNTLSAGDLNGYVYALVVFDDGSGPALFAGGSFTTAGGVTANNIAKWDGTSWSPLLVGVNNGVNNNVNALAVWDDGTGPALYAGGNFTNTGGVAANRIAKWDGSTWSPLSSGTNSNVYALTVFDDGFGSALYVGGGFSTAGGITANRIARWDGFMWSPLDTGIVNYYGVGVFALTTWDPDGLGGNPTVLIAGGDISTAGGVSAARVAQWDGAIWSPLGTGIFGTGDGRDRVLALAAFDGDGNGPTPAYLFAGGGIGGGCCSSAVVRRWDGISWSNVGSFYGSNEAVTVLAGLDPDGSGPAPELLFAGGSFTTAGGGPANRIAKWDGTEWSTLGMGVSGANGSVLAVATFDDGSATRLYAGGEFTTAGNVNADRIASWDTTQWRALGYAMNNGEVFSLTVFDNDGAGPIPTTLYGGGTFTTAGGISANYVAERTPTGWVPLASGMSGGSPTTSVNSLAGYDPDSGGALPGLLYAGGNFTIAGGVSANRVAKWNGAAWSALGTGTNGPVYALSVYDDGGGPDLYVTGSFTMAGGTTRNRIARWDGSSWSSLGNGLNSAALALAVFNDGTGPALYVGGNFTNAAGVPALRVARWNGSSWSALGSGMNDEVDALAVFDDGSGPALYATGLFTTAGGVSANRIARWNGSSWSALANGLNGQGLALSTYDDGFGMALYAGGLFTTANGINVDRFAKWDGTAWSTLSTGMGGIVTGSLAVRTLVSFDEDASGQGPAGLFVGGNFTTAGSIPSGRIARWGCSTPLCSDSGDTDNDGVADCFDNCPSTISGAVVDASGCTPVIYGDAERDGDVDAADFDAFDDCLSGPAVPASSPCLSYDLDSDGDVDMDEFGIFQRCMSGENIQADPTCDD